MTAVGDEIPAWRMAEVRAEPMQTMAALLRDPNPVHWDRASTHSRGLEGRLVNQGPINVGYLANMLMQWQGPTCIRRLKVQFPDRVLDGDEVNARGVVTGVDSDTALCEVWLERPDGSRPVVGQATVQLSRS